jgi:hypothetical protein
MIRNLTIVAVASFVLCVGCFAGAFALGGRDLIQHGWSFPRNLPKDWHVEVDDGDDHVTIRPDGQVEALGEATRQIAWTGGETLQVDLPADVTYTQAAPGAQAGVTVAGPKRLVDQVILENGALRLSDKPDNGESSVVVGGRHVHILGHGERLTIAITAPSVHDFTLNGSGDLHLVGYDQSRLGVAINGSGGVTGEGKTKLLELRVSGSGSADLGDVEAGDAKVAVAGSGDATLSPHGAAQVQVAGSGDVTLNTQPATLSSDVAGSGEVHQNW